MNVNNPIIIEYIPNSLMIYATIFANDIIFDIANNSVYFI